MQDELAQRRSAMETALTLPAGATLDAYVAACLTRLGRSVDNIRPKWSSDARAVCYLIDELTLPALMKTPWNITFSCGPEMRRRGHWQCTIECGDWSSDGTGDSMPLAFCRALIIEYFEET